MNYRAVIVRALDALELGDPREAEAILLSVLEDGPSEPRLRCDLCSWTGKWPGELDDHRRIFHAEAA